LKRVYAAVTALKGKSGIKWSDKNGMGITEDTQQQWDEMVKVRERVQSGDTN
jgi:hypothetical protein